MKKLLSIGLAFSAALLAGCSQQSQPVTLRVMSYNIHHGEGLDGRLDLERIAGIIREARPDLVALQEVDRGTARTQQMDQPARLAELTGMEVVFARNIDLQGGEYGNAVLSRLPILEHENHYLPQKNLPSEQRGLLEVHVRLSGGKLIFFATHFDHRPDDAERLASLAVLRERVDDYGACPAIVAGDFNAEPDSQVIRTATECLEGVGPAGADLALSYPANEPDKRIDYVLHNRHAGVKLLESRVLAEPVASDHRPVLAVFELDSRPLCRE